jgi:hypothetical protein
MFCFCWVLLLVFILVLDGSVFLHTLRCFCDALFSSDDGPSKCVLNNVRSKVRCGVILYDRLSPAGYVALDTPR